MSEPAFSDKSFIFTGAGAYKQDGDRWAIYGVATLGTGGCSITSSITGEGGDAISLFIDVYDNLELIQYLIDEDSDDDYIYG